MPDTCRQNVAGCDAFVRRRPGRALRSGFAAIGLFGLTVLAPAQSVLYWDTNGSTSGAGSTPTATWSTSASNKDWTTNAFGTSSTIQWTDGSNANFSAGFDATGPFTVTVSGTVSAANLIVLMGNPTFTGGTINLGGSSPIVSTILGSTATINSIVTGTGGLTKSGFGTLTLGNASNSYTGATAISAGTLQLGAANALPSGTAVTVASGATFSANGFTQTVGSVAGAGAISLGTGSLTAGGNNTSTTFGGSLTGTGTFTKAGTGTLSLTSNISFGGTFVLSSGTLQLSGSTLTLGTLNITGNSVIDFGGSAATLNVSNLFIQAGSTLSIINWQDGVDFFYASNWSGASYYTAGSNPMNQVSFSGYNANNTRWQSYDNQITPVPEPAGYGAGLFGILSLLCGLYRSRPKKGRLQQTCIT
jgi:autotransporter-associated beta strand protein